MTMTMKQKTVDDLIDIFLIRRYADADGDLEAAS
jgi:hypothetical protein